MAIGTQQKILLIGSLLVVLSSTAMALSLYTHTTAPPEIQGTVLIDGRPLAPFALTDHRGEPFNREDLMGQWHLVSYGYTYCPDMCPMTLMTLAKFYSRVDQESNYKDLQVLFYSVDPERDSPAQLANYAPKIHPGFVGLTRLEQESLAENPFEHSLGLASKIEPAEDEQAPQTYNVSHGVQLYLINPQAELQAVFDSRINDHNLFVFNEETLFRDYQTLRDYFSRQAVSR